MKAPFQFDPDLVKVSCPQILIMRVVVQSVSKGKFRLASFPNSLSAMGFTAQPLHHWHGCLFDVLKDLNALGISSRIQKVEVCAVFRGIQDYRRTNILKTANVSHLVRVFGNDSVIAFRSFEARKHIAERIFSEEATKTLLCLYLWCINKPPYVASHEVY